MASKRSGQALHAEVALLQSLKNCLVNLPAPLVAVLVNANTVAQNVVVQLTVRQPRTPDSKTPPSHSIFVGWTGMQSKQKLPSIVGRDGTRGGTVGREQDLSMVEVDATFGRLVGLTEGEKVEVTLHLDPPQAHTVNIEPLTPADWEMIELHAQFLELNFLSQIRALPNPSFVPGPSHGRHPHPLTLHLSPTSTANITVTSLTPVPASTSPFVKISPDAEVIVAPKTRQRGEKSHGREGSRSVASTGKRSTGGKSGASTVRHRSRGSGDSSREPFFLRGVDRRFCDEWFEEEDETGKNEGLTIWMDKEILQLKAMRGVTYANVAVVKPAGILEPLDPNKDTENEKPATKIVAKVRSWDDAPSSLHVCLSTELRKAFGVETLVGGLIRIEAAPPQLGARPSSSSKSPSASATSVRALKILPFASSISQQGVGLKFGGESKQEKDAAAQRLQKLFGKEGNGSRLLQGPLTDGMILPAREDWQGGILRFDPTAAAGDPTKSPVAWIMGSDKNVPLDVQPEITKSTSAFASWIPGDPLPEHIPHMVGIDNLLEQLMDQLSHTSSVMLTGGLGAGKTSLAQLLAHSLRSQYLFSIIYFPCRILVTDETRVSTIKETLGRCFAAASWGARLGGKSLVILDDLDKLCPAETELQVGGENGRSRQISESLCSIVRQYSSMDSNVALLATAQSKEALNNVIIGGHVVREIISVKAPDKESRRRVLETLIKKDSKLADTANISNGVAERPTVNGNHSWHDSSSPINSRPGTSQNRSLSTTSAIPDRFTVDPTIDYLDLAGQTDGYMPGDLVLLVSRARSESLIRSVSSPGPNAPLMLTKADFSAALKGFTPASLRNVTLQTSTVRWSSIGGLHTTRKILLETLQYPTTYSPLFSKCPLRLRSGLLLYGYPGSGKTLLASAVASECGLNFISVKGPEILNKYIGASEKSVRDLFERAEAARPCVLFFDEFDSIAPKRGHDSTGVTDRVVNQLLTQMDGAEGVSKGVYILAATSRPDLIDPALLRPGRLDKSLECGMPNLEDRVDILRAVGEKVRFAATVRDVTEGGSENLWDVARRTDGFTGADLQALVYNAQLEAIHDVLGDVDQDFGTSKPTTKGAGKGSSKGVPEFTHFEFGDDSLGDDATAVTPAMRKERLEISNKLATMQAARRKHRQLYPSPASVTSSGLEGLGLRHQRGGSISSTRARSIPGPHPNNTTMNGVDDEGGSDDSNEDINADAGDPDAEEPGSKEPVIQWRHMLASLQQTRASISPQERRRLEGIYREFVWGRNGEMPSGQGGTEVGGRSSLM